MKIKNVILKNKQHRIFIKKMQATQENNKSSWLSERYKKKHREGRKKNEKRKIQEKSNNGINKPISFTF